MTSDPKQIAEGLTEFARDAEKCAEFYEGSRGLVGPEVVIDLYRAIARLSNIVAAHLTGGSHD